MLEITIRSIDQTRADAAAAARRLKDAINGSTRAFFEVAWKLASILAPVGSDPAGYFLNPVTGMKYRHEEVGWLWSSDHPKDEEQVFAILDSGSVPAYMARFLRAKCAPARSDVLPAGESVADKRREWICSSLVDPPLPDQLASLPSGFLREPWVHLGAFIWFHLGDLPRYSELVLRQEDSRRLPLFWKGFLRWHAGKRGDETTAMLTSVAKSPRVSSGKRKTALLLLWTQSTATPTHLVQLTRSVQQLLRRDILHFGSPPPVFPCVSFSGRSPRQILEEMESRAKILGARQDNEAKADLVPLAKELLGATAELPAVEGVLHRLRDAAMRALVHGSCPIERLNVAWVLSVLTKRPFDKQIDMDIAWIDAHLSSLRMEADGWCQGTVGAEDAFALRDHTIRALDIEEWSPLANQLLAKLVPSRDDARQGEPTKWPGAIIASRSMYTGVPPHSCPTSRAIQFARDGVAVNIPALAERPEDIRAYVERGRRPAGEMGWEPDALKYLMERKAPPTLEALDLIAKSAEGLARSCGRVSVECVKKATQGIGVTGLVGAPRGSSGPERSRTAGARGAKTTGPLLINAGSKDVLGEITKDGFWITRQNSGEELQEVRLTRVLRGILSCAYEQSREMAARAAPSGDPDETTPLALSFEIQDLRSFVESTSIAPSADHEGSPKPTSVSRQNIERLRKSVRFSDGKYLLEEGKEHKAVIWFRPYRSRDRSQRERSIETLSMAERYRSGLDMPRGDSSSSD